MFLTLAPDQVGIGVLEARTSALPQRDAKLELHQVLASDEAGEVQRRAKKLATDALHFGLSGIRAPRKTQNVYQVCHAPLHIGGVPPPHAPTQPLPLSAARHATSPFGKGY